MIYRLYPSRRSSRQRKLKERYNLRTEVCSRAEIISLFHNFENLSVLKVPGKEKIIAVPKPIKLFQQTAQQFVNIFLKKIGPRTNACLSAEGEIPRAISFFASSLSP